MISNMNTTWGRKKMQQKLKVRASTLYESELGLLLGYVFSNTLPRNAWNVQ